MNLKAIKKLCCPMCEGHLVLEAIETENIKFHDKELSTKSNSLNSEEGMFEYAVEEEIKEGLLICNDCKVWYPISNYVPVMLVFSTPFHNHFSRKHHLKLTDGYTFPKWRAMPGEKKVQETFTEEWNTLKDDDLSFVFTNKELTHLHREVYLQWPETPPPSVREVLNVGCGFGTEAAVLSDILKDAHVFGIDLNFSLLNSGQLFVKNSFVHLVIASLFHLPFNKSSFDLVYCQGVLHHTYSTYDAFKNIAAFVKKGGYIFTWVYALDDHLVNKGILGFFTKLKYLLEKILRPTISRLPKTLRRITLFSLSLIFYVIERSRSRHKEKWKLKNTIHGLYDLFSPRFAYRHSFNEVIEWYENLGFTFKVHSPATYRKLFGTRLYGIGVLGQKNNTNIE